MESYYQQGAADCKPSHGMIIAWAYTHAACQMKFHNQQGSADCKGSHGMIMA